MPEERDYDDASDEEGMGMQRLRNFLASKCCFNCFAMVVAAASHTTPDASKILEFFPGLDALTEVDGHYIYARCSGTGSPAVVFRMGSTGTV